MPLLCRWHNRSPPAGRTLTKCSLGAGGGRRPPPRPNEAACTPLGLDQCGSRFGSRPGEAPPWPSPPLSHAQSPTRRSPGAGGRQLPPRPSEAAGTPPGLDQCGSRTGSRPGEGPPWPSPPLSHAWSPTGRSSGIGGGRQPPPRPGEAAGTPSGLNQCTGSRPREGRRPLSSFLSLPCRAGTARSAGPMGQIF